MVLHAQTATPGLISGVSLVWVDLPCSPSLGGLPVRLQPIELSLWLHASHHSAVSGWKRDAGRKGERALKAVRDTPRHLLNISREMKLDGLDGLQRSLPNLRILWDTQPSPNHHAHYTSFTLPELKRSRNSQPYEPTRAPTVHPQYTIQGHRISQWLGLEGTLRAT